MNTIKEFRLKKKLTQRELAAFLNISTSSMSQYESGKREPRIKMLKKLSVVLECSVDDLL